MGLYMKSCGKPYRAEAGPSGGPKAEAKALNPTGEMSACVRARVCVRVRLSECVHVRARARV